MRDAVSVLGLEETADDRVSGRLRVTTRCVCLFVETCRSPARRILGFDLGHAPEQCWTAASAAALCRYTATGFCGQLEANG